MRYILVLTLLLVAGLNSCKDDVVHPGFRQSLNSWEYFKKTSNNSYKYTQVLSSSVFSNGGAEILVKINNGIITSREYTRFEYKNGTKEKITIEQWNEGAAQVNTHTDVPKSLTLDEIYDKAEHEWLKQDKKTNTIVFETNLDGLISNCGYIPKNCQDDCFTGIALKSITTL
jgi:hypothetical protein